MNDENDHVTTMPRTTRPPRPPAGFGPGAYAVAGHAGVVSSEADELERGRVPALAGALA